MISDSGFGQLRKSGRHEGSSAGGNAGFLADAVGVATVGRGFSWTAGSIVGVGGLGGVKRLEASGTTGGMVTGEWTTGSSSASSSLSSSSSSSGTVTPLSVLAGVAPDGGSETAESSDALRFCRCDPKSRHSASQSSSLLTDCQILNSSLTVRDCKSSSSSAERGPPRFCSSTDRMPLVSMGIRPSLSAHEKNWGLRAWLGFGNLRLRLDRLPC